MDLVRIAELACEVRAFLEPRWAGWYDERGRPRPLIPSESMCRFSALFLTRVLEEEIDGGWRVVGGTPDADPRFAQEMVTPLAPGGFRDQNGIWRGHYWAEHEGKGTIVDVTADQFGAEAVLVMEEPDERYFANYLGWAVREDLAGVARRVETWLSEWQAERRSAPAP